MRRDGGRGAEGGGSGGGGGTNDKQNRTKKIHPWMVQYTEGVGRVERMVGGGSVFFLV